MFALILLLVVGVIGWCAWRLLAKKRAKPAKQTDIDEQAILDAMEEDLEPTEEELKVFYYLLKIIRMINNIPLFTVRALSKSILASCSTNSSTISTPRPSP